MCILAKDNQYFHLLVYIEGLLMSPHSRQGTFADQKFDPKIQLCQRNHSLFFVSLSQGITNHHRCTGQLTNQLAGAIATWNW